MENKITGLLKKPKYLKKAAVYYPKKQSTFPSKILKQGLKDAGSILYSNITNEFYYSAQELFRNHSLRKGLGIKIKNGALIGKEVQLGKQVKVESGAAILGKTKILEGKIKRGAVIVDCVVRNIDAESESLGILIEQINSNRVIIKDNHLLSDVIILDKGKYQGIIKKIRVSFDLATKVNEIWEEKLFAEPDNKNKYSLKELSELSKFGISNLENMSANILNRYYFYLGGSYKEFKKALLDQSLDNLFMKIKISERIGNGPVLQPRDIVWQGIYWEKLVYNATSVRIKGMTYFVYRAVGEDNVSRLGFAWSRNGIDIDGRLTHPILWADMDEIHPNAAERPRESGGFEDPHITLLEKENHLYMLYTLAFATEQSICQQAITSISVEDFIGLPDTLEVDIRQKWKKHGLVSTHEERNGIIFPEKINGKYAMIRRPMMGKSTDLEEYVHQERFVGISFSEKVGELWPEEIKSILRVRIGMWDSERVGPCALLKTRHGWLLFYHGMGKLRGRESYMIGWALLDINNPCRVIARCDEPIFISEEDYELYGWVPNVVIAYGATIRGKDSNQIAEEDSEIIVSYGGADRVVGLFSVKLSDIIPEEIKKNLQ
ncbi:MAG: hypothetical protein KAU95_01450 [Candidatus Aenigmarchaeota archaeon]|nr:hypothetical protein [Candidatus Aenigmarchaeota archaeon]